MPDLPEPDAGVWSTPLRVNLRYAPTLAWVRLTGRLLAPHTTELVRILEVLEQLPAPVDIDLSAVEEVDGQGVAVITEHRRRRAARGAAPLRIADPGRFGWAF